MAVSAVTFAASTSSEEPKFLKVVILSHETDKEWGFFVKNIDKDVCTLPKEVVRN